MRLSVASRASALALVLLVALATAARPQAPELTDEIRVEWTSDWVRGTTLAIGYGLGDSEPVRYGDLVELRCRFFAAGDTTRACDSLVVSARAGSTDLPLGVNWLLLGLVWQPVNWERPITLRKELLDRRFTRCGPDERGVYALRISIVHADQPVTPDAARELSAARQAIAAYREERFEEALPQIRTLAKAQPKSPLWHALYAGVLLEQGLCAQYERQAMAVARLTGAELAHVGEKALAQCGRHQTWRAEERKRSR